LMLFRTLPVAPGCNKAPEKEKTSGNHYNQVPATRLKGTRGHIVSSIFTCKLR